MALIGNPIVASQPIDDTISSTSKNPVQNKVVKAELNKKVDTANVESSLSASSENPVQNKAIVNTLQAGTQATKLYHLGFYLDSNGDLCYDAE